MNERMLESYIIARDRFLVPNGKMFPSQGRLELFVLVYLYPLVVFISVNFFCLVSFEKNALSCNGCPYTAQCQ